MTYLEQLEYFIQAEKDAKHDFQKLVTELINKGFSWQQLFEHMQFIGETTKPATE